MGVQTVKCRNPKNKWGSVLLWTPLTFIDGQKKVLFLIPMKVIQVLNNMVSK